MIFSPWHFLHWGPGVVIIIVAVTLDLCNESKDTLPIFPAQNAISRGTNYRKLYGLTSTEKALSFRYASLRAAYHF
jgi:hypothetical protein